LLLILWLFFELLVVVDMLEVLLRIATVESADLGHTLEPLVVALDLGHTLAPWVVMVVGHIILIQHLLSIVVEPLVAL
jgi:hypothetical protein